MTTGTSVLLAGTSVLLVEQKALAALEIANWSYVPTGGRTVPSSSASAFLQREDLGDAFLGRVAAGEPRQVGAGSP